MAKIILKLPSGSTLSKHNALQGLNEDNYIHLTQLEKANLDNQSGINTGDETTSSIQTKRPLKTVNNKSLEGTGNIEIDYNTVINKPSTFPPSAHTHTVSQITDFPTFKTIENQSIVGAGNIDLNKSDVGLSNVDNTSDANKPVSTVTQTALNLKVSLTEKGAANGVATLGSDGKVPNSQIPALAISETFPVASQAEMLALSQAEQGDVAIRLDISKSYILRASPSSVLSNWSELLSPTDAVISVNGQTGVVNLTKSDVGLGNADNTSDLNKPISTATQTALNGKEPIIPTGTALQYIKGDKTLGTFPTVPTVDQTIIDGSANAVSGKAVFDGLATKSNIGHTHVASQITDLSKASVGLGNVDNTSDLSKPLSTATINALATKFPTPTGLTTNYLPKWNGSGFVNSKIFDNNVGISFGGSVFFGGYEFLTPAFGNNTIYIGTPDGTQNPRVYISHQTVSNQPQKVVLGSAFSAGQATASWYLENGRFVVGSLYDNGEDKLQVNGSGIFSGEVKAEASFSTSDQSAYYFRGGTNPLDAAVYGSGVNKFVDIWINQAQKARFDGNGLTVNGNITASPAVSPNQVVVKSQLDAVGRPYKVYTALLSQSGTNAPIATVLENTIGNIVWSRNSNGVYFGTLSGAFTVDKTGIMATPSFSNIIVSAIRSDNNSIIIRTSTSGTLSDSGLTNVLTEIRVYN